MCFGLELATCTNMQLLTGVPHKQGDDVAVDVEAEVAHDINKERKEGRGRWHTGRR